MAKKTILKEEKSPYDLKQLIELERASLIIINKLERSCRNYDNSITNSTETELFKKYNLIHEDVIKKIMKELDKYEF